VLGNYSLTLIDSLSTLAILASAPPDEVGTGAKALSGFQNGISALVQQYGDGTEGSSGLGLRARGFDLDSKVQVFETVIRGVGGLLSAHLFAIGELPITGYSPWRKSKGGLRPKNGESQPIAWPNGFRYDGQLLRLALDLAQRLLPAFFTDTGLPYPRVNLRHGVPFYDKSPLNRAPDTGDNKSETFEGPNKNEITETCSAGAGSLVLEFTVLSRLTGDPRFEQIAKRAFWAVWNRRSSLGLIGAGIDPEVGHWIGANAGIGAGTDSFFEYALKTHILLSGLDTPNSSTKPKFNISHLDPNVLYRPLTAEENSPEAFLDAWKEAHTAIKRHLYSGTHHPHYVNAHLGTGSPQTYWIDSLGAYYPGLLTLAGELNEAIETHLLYTALWTRYSALPERWSVRDGTIEGGLGWWPGRPEFIESNYHLYRATKDPWYLHVGEMALKDIKRRCWTTCGWAGLQDVRTGEKSDRMESFFLGETAKYLYLLFDPDHPLNSLDAPYVFTTEGHPLIIPRKGNVQKARHQKIKSSAVQSYIRTQKTDSCPVPPAFIPLSFSPTAARADVFHAANLIGLPKIANQQDGKLIPTSVTEKGVGSSSNHTFYPWTLPQSLVPPEGTCAPVPLATTFTIEFPTNSQAPSNPSFNMFLPPQNIVRLNDNDGYSQGIMVKSLSGVKVGLVLEKPSPLIGEDGKPIEKSWRMWSVGSLPLGRDEKVFISRDVIGAMVDPSFTRIRDPVSADLVIQTEITPEIDNSANSHPSPLKDNIDRNIPSQVPETNIEQSASGRASEMKTMLSSLLQHVTFALRDPVATLLPQPAPEPTYRLAAIPALAPTGLGAAPFPEVSEAPDPQLATNPGIPLTWKKIYFAGQACSGPLPAEVVRDYQVIVMRRGGCSFSEKVASIPPFVPNAKGGFQFVIVVRDEKAEGEEGDKLIRPFLDQLQLTPKGLRRRHEVRMAMVGGGEETENLLRRATGVGLRRRYWVESQGVAIGNLIVV
jgi:hypothetical protein